MDRLLNAEGQSSFGFLNKENNFSGYALCTIPACFMIMSRVPFYERKSNSPEASTETFGNIFHHHTALYHIAT
jgi:hypothetical protein